MDILDLLQADHDAVHELNIEFRIVDENSTREAEVFRALVALVKNQDAAREHVFTRTELALPLTASLARAFQDCRDRVQAAEEVEKIIECCTNKSTWRAAAMVYCELLESRLHAEVRELLPALHDDLDRRARARLATTYRLARGFVRAPAAATESKNWRKIWNRVVGHAS